MRKQDHFWPSERGLQAWDVHRLIESSKNLPVREIRVSSIDEVDTVYWCDEDHQEPTVRSVVEHARLIEETDSAWPIIPAADGRVMHRIDAGSILLALFQRSQHAEVLERAGIPCHFLPRSNVTQ